MASGNERDIHEKPAVLKEFSLKGVAKFIKKEKPKHIIVMTGAGISTSAGIPDFRSPGTGLYDNLAQYNLPDPMAIFEIGYFMQNPKPFFTLAKELFPKHVKPTPCHYFIRLLEEKGLLLRTYTQNIDSLEHVAGVNNDKIITAHGSCHSNTCMMCKEVYPMEWMTDKLNAPDADVPRCEVCEGVVKPDIVFFGEALPRRFFAHAISDFPKCDLLIIMGTSLVVQPFASMIGEVGNSVPRLLINMTKAGQIGVLEKLSGLPGLHYDSNDNY
uniref:NAD-dependent protein deacetylase n=1 Tax=Plectus sambesii TaxID=2011161 RepID=A0A914W7F9_9BILA